MTHTAEREDFLITMAAEGLDAHTARRVMRSAATLHRLAEAQCNGTWPADNGVRPVVYCGGAVGLGCGGLWDASVLRGRSRACPDCRAQARILELLDPFGIVPNFHGDPRGAAVVLRVPSHRTNDWGQTGICVP